MSYYTEFQVNEATLTASATSTGGTLQSTDSMLVYNNNQNHPFQVPIGSISALGQVTAATSGSTATNISPFGITQVTASTSFAWLLSDPPAPGLMKTLFNTSSTSTANQVNFVSASGKSTDSQSISSVGFSAGGAYFELQAISTSAWLVLGRSVAGAHSS